MPANKKYLTNSPLDKIIRILSGFGMGYLINILFFSIMGKWIDQGSVLMTVQFLGFLLWAVLLITSFLIKNPWKGLLYYSVITVVLYIVLINL